MWALGMVLLSRHPPATRVCCSADVARLVWAVHLPAETQPF